ncbi:MAG TPA: alpha/beta hydrolase-fold protein [Terriglobia bacterium]|nr:alpha/beta hydrolase-fold protein [Terriglobia bacterium]
MIRAFVLLFVFTLELTAQRAPAGFGRDSIPAGSRVEYKTFESKLLGRELRYGIYLPPSYASSPTKKYPVLYFLHGAFENEMRWSTLGQTDLKLDEMIKDGKIGEFIVALPSANNSFYTNTRDGSEKWEDVIISEFIPMIESTYRVNATRTTRGISGTSMGGYGALKLAMKHPELFGSVSAHSAVLLQDLSAAKVSGGRLQMFQSMFDHIYGINQDLTYWEANNPMTLAKDTKKLNGMKIYFDCGTEDTYGFDVGARQLDEMLTKASYPHEAHLYPGGHGWDFNKNHTSESLLFHWRAFSGK